MRRTLGLAIAAGLALLLWASAARAQAYGPLGNGPATGRYLNEGVGYMPTPPVSIYATDMLPESLSHPWVMVPRYSTLAPSLRFGDPFSPYGYYTRYAYYATGPYPAVTRPYVRFDKHWHD